MKKNLLLMSILLTALVMSSGLAMAPGSSTSRGIEVNQFTTDSEVYVFHMATVVCDGLLENKELRTYVVANKNWTDGDSINNPVVNTTITTDENSKFQASLIWDSPEVGAYDIIIDLNNNGKYDAGGSCVDLLDEDGPVGFKVIEASGEVAEEEANVTEENQTTEDVTNATEETTNIVEETQPDTVNETTDDNKRFDIVPFIIIFMGVIIAGTIVFITLKRMR